MTFDLIFGAMVPSDPISVTFVGQRSRSQEE